MSGFIPTASGVALGIFVLLGVFSVPMGLFIAMGFGHSVVGCPPHAVELLFKRSECLTSGALLGLPLLIWLRVTVQRNEDKTLRTYRAAAVHVLVFLLSIVYSVFWLRAAITLGNVLSTCS
jgi:hypothetical protein